MKIYDISIPISPKMPTYPGDPPVEIKPIKRIGKGSRSNVSRVAFGDHTGTHFDPPVHFIPGGATIDQLDLSVLYGPARVVDFTRVAREITARDLERARIPNRVTRLLFTAAFPGRGGLVRSGEFQYPVAAMVVVACFAVYAAASHKRRICSVYYGICHHFCNVAFHDAYERFSNLKLSCHFIFSFHAVPVMACHNAEPKNHAPKNKNTATQKNVTP